MKKLLGILAAVLAFSSPAKAENAAYTFDTVHSQILFSVNHMGFSHSHGQFVDFDGDISFDPENPSAGAVNVTIQTASIDMNDEAWDNHLKNEDFFNVEKYPTMTFKSTGVEIIDEKNAKLTGDLTILDVTKPVTLDVVLNGAGPHPRSGKPHIGFSATGTIKRSDFGMTYGVPMVGDEVSIIIEVEASAEGEEAVTAE